MVNQRWFRNLAIFIWIISLIVLTFMLLDPRPITVHIDSPIDWQYIMAKTFHIGCYFFVTFLGLWLWSDPRWRICYAGVMVWHAIGTEIGQSYIPTRHGDVKDVAIDCAGITLACLLTWFRHRGRID
jgi:VanZ family protein